MRAAKNLFDFLLPADTRHALKFRNDPFRGVDEIGCEKATFAKQKAARDTAMANKEKQKTKLVCPRSRGKTAALLGVLATPRARPKPARLARPTRMQFCLLYTSDAADE